MRAVVGIHSCRTALTVRAEKELIKICFKPDWQKNPALKKLFALALEKGLAPEVMSVKKLNFLSQSHQGVAVYVKGRPKFHPEKLSENAVILALESVEDPKNLGAVIRTSWLMGVEGVFISRRRSAGLTPSALKSASGGAEYVPVETANIPQCLERLKQNRFHIYGLDANSPHTLWRENFKGRTAFVLGGEQSGLKPLTRKICDKILSIPQTNSSANYNVSVSAGMVLAERRRRKSTDS